MGSRTHTHGELLSARHSQSYPTNHMHIHYDRSAPGVLAAVKAAMKATGSTKVVITGHSLGAAIALLDAVYLPLHLPASTTFTTNVFGLPRVGNPAFASYGEFHGHFL